MNISLKNRVSSSFVAVNIFVLVLGFTVFFYLDSLNKEVEQITKKSNQINFLTDRTRISAVTILRYQRRLLTNKNNEELVSKIIESSNSFSAQLQALGNYYTDAEVKEIIGKMSGLIESLKVTLSKASLFHRDTVGILSIQSISDKILDTFTQFQDLQREKAEERDKSLKKIISETKKTMMITLICTFLLTILLGLIIPGSIALPFKKINDAIRELQDCNFDVSIYYDQDDEIGEIAREMNKMIQSMKKFEELRTDRISVEHKKFDMLASMMKRYVLVANAKGDLIYMNNQLFSLLEVSSDEVLHKSVSDIKIPGTIKETYELAIKRRSKIENAEIKIAKNRAPEELEKMEKSENVMESDESVTPEIVEEELLFTGYANVVPIRGKESSLDYYLMVLSTEVFS